MRPPTALALGVIAATLGVVSALVPSETAVAESRQPRCGAVSGAVFPIDTEMRGGPTVHHPGKGFREWAVDLANTTGKGCANVHPVIVFTPRDRGFTTARVTVEFYDQARARWRPAELETTSEDEVIAILDGAGTGGFAVPARATVTVRVRLALRADTPPNQVTVNAAIVQRRGDDGDWVGESGEYRFAVLDDRGYGATVTDDELATTGPTSLRRLGIALGTVLCGGGVLVVASWRLRRWRARR
ncbi:hypothetical protein ACFVIM_19035 [Streptomyces sp. NPDC057638]|uniref:hypothetical protein n=1 Tax=Streptomyces sp. NPDC057638 TaxID=3346190 RepID=UPI003699E7EB